VSNKRFPSPEPNCNSESRERFRALRGFQRLARISIFSVNYQFDQNATNALMGVGLDGIGRCGGGEAVGETQNRPFQLSFNSSLKVDFQGSRVTSDGGLVLGRELDERLGLNELVDRHLSDSGEARISNCLWPTCCGSRSIAGWRVTKMLTTPRGSPGSDLPAHWLAEDLGAGRGLDLALAVVRD
jgi:hypothetical protein